jgi:hypothetical protein
MRYCSPPLIREPRIRTRTATKTLTAHVCCEVVVALLAFSEHREFSDCV